MFLINYYFFSQSAGIGAITPDSSAALDISKSGKGFLIPGMSISSINAIINPTQGLMIYDSPANQLVVNTGTSLIPNWQPVVGNTGKIRSLDGNPRH